MNAYNFEITCWNCGGELEHITGASSIKGTETRAVARCKPCKRDWLIEIRMSTVQMNFGVRREPKSKKAP